MREYPKEEQERQDARPTAPCTISQRVDADTALFELEKQFNALAAEILALQSGAVRQSACGWSDDETATRLIESVLARLEPIERAIMVTPAQTIAGLGVKARHAAYVISQYWNGPTESLDWDAQAVRLLIEATCNLARLPLPFSDKAPNAAVANIDSPESEAASL